MLVLRHVDITARKEEARDLVQLTEASLGLLDLIFPRHIIEYMTWEASTPEAPTSDSAAATPAPAARGGVAGAVSKPSAASLCLRTLSSGNDFRHLTTHHEQVGKGRGGGRVRGQALGV